MRKRGPKNCKHSQILFASTSSIDSDRYHLVKCERCGQVGRDHDAEFQLGLRNYNKKLENYRKSNAPSGRWCFGQMSHISAGGDCEFGNLIDLGTGKKLSWELLGFNGLSDRYQSGTILKFQPNQRRDRVCAIAPLTPLETEYYRFKLSLEHALSA